MNLGKCGNGHIYDADAYTSCPYCKKDEKSIDFTNTENSPDLNCQNSVGKTTHISRSAIEEEILSSVVDVIPVDYIKDRNKIRKTVGIFSDKNEMSPVVGWLVCTEGVNKGSDYRIGAKLNTIGRDEVNDICIAGDDTVSKVMHAKLDCDVNNYDFYLIPAENRNTIYINDVPVYAATKLEQYDRIQLGDSQFVFVPFCYDWKAHSDPSDPALAYLFLMGKLHCADKQYTIKIQVENNPIISLTLLGKQRSDDAKARLCKDGIISDIKQYYFSNWPNANPRFERLSRIISACVCELQEDIVYHLRLDTPVDVPDDYSSSDALDIISSPSTDLDHYPVLYGCPNPKSVSYGDALKNINISIVDYEK